MSVASRSLISNKPLFSDESSPGVPPGRKQPSWKESFPPDASVSEDGMLSPISISPSDSRPDQGGISKAESPLRSDVPDLILQPGTLT
jgi:hypothetical protein